MGERPKRYRNAVVPHIYVNDARITDLARLSDAVGDRDEVFVFQALTGG